MSAPTAAKTPLGSRESYQGPTKARESPLTWSMNRNLTANAASTVATSTATDPIGCQVLVLLRGVSALGVASTACSLTSVSSSWCCGHSQRTSAEFEAG